jgi:hypothetical protein
VYASVTGRARELNVAPSDIRITSSSIQVCRRRTGRCMLYRFSMLQHFVCICLHIRSIGLDVTYCPNPP